MGEDCIEQAQQREGNSSVCVGSVGVWVIGYNDKRVILHNTLNDRLRANGQLVLVQVLWSREDAQLEQHALPQVVPLQHAGHSIP